MTQFDMYAYNNSSNDNMIRLIMAMTMVIILYIYCMLINYIVYNMGYVLLMTNLLIGMHPQIEIG